MTIRNEYLDQYIKDCYLKYFPELKIPENRVSLGIQLKLVNPDGGLTFDRRVYPRLLFNSYFPNIFEDEILDLAQSLFRFSFRELIQEAPLSQINESFKLIEAINRMKILFVDSLPKNLKIEENRLEKFATAFSLIILSTHQNLINLYTVQKALPNIVLWKRFVKLFVNLPKEKDSQVLNLVIPKIEFYLRGKILYPSSKYDINWGSVKKDLFHTFNLLKLNDFEMPKIFDSYEEGNLKLFILLGKAFEDSLESFSVETLEILYGNQYPKNKNKEQIDWIRVSKMYRERKYFN